MDTKLTQKLNELKEILRNMGSAAIAYSGGVDSTFLLKIANEVLGQNVIAITADSETYPQRELEDAKKFAQDIGARHIVIETSELGIEGFADNPPDRCFYCKQELFTKIRDIANEYNIKYVLDGSNYDDRNDHRPGMRAARSLGVKSPIKEAKLSKSDIREISKELGLATWDKPSFACLSSRFPYGTKITKDKLIIVGEAEEYLRALGFTELRVRYHDNIARIEVNKTKLNEVIACSEQIVEKLRALGFTYVTLDLDGYKTGSMNYTLDESEKSIESR